MIKKVTITGADGSIRPGALKHLSAMFPFAEWGILVSRKSMGGNRFPDLEWLQELAIIKKDSPDMKLSLHLCGAYVREVLKGDASFINEIGTEVFDIFERVQINTHGEPHDFNAERMINFMNSCTGKEFIFQFDNANEEILEAARAGGVNCSTLFDMSHGAGVLPGSWPLPFDNVPCGYAGGLSCDNLVQQIGLIEDKVGERSIWIDVETKVRSNNDQQFDLGLVKTFLEISGTHIKAGIIPQRGVVILTEAEQDFATHVGYEVKLKDGGTGINMGLYFPETWAEDGILKANGVNVFFPEQNKIYTMNFNQVELIFPNGITRMNQAEAIFGFGAWLTTRTEAITVGAAHSTPAFLELMQHFIKVNNLPRCRENWSEFLIPMPLEAPVQVFPNTKHNSACLDKAKDDEPIFVLLGRDSAAPYAIASWIGHSKESQPQGKLDAADQVIRQMDEYRTKKA